MGILGLPHTDRRVIYVYNDTYPSGQPVAMALDEQVAADICRAYNEHQRCKKQPNITDPNPSGGSSEGPAWMVLTVEVPDRFPQSLWASLTQALGEDVYCYDYNAYGLFTQPTDHLRRAAWFFQVYANDMRDLVSEVEDTLRGFPPEVKATLRGLNEAGQVVLYGTRGGVQ